MTSGGTVYACGDAGTVSGGTGGYLATYTVTANSTSCVGTGIATAVSVNYHGTGYTTFQTALATTATSGSGSGLTVQTNAFGAWLPYVQIQAGANNNFMGDVTVATVGSGQTAGTFTIYDSGTGSATCVAAGNTGSHCASIAVTIANGAITTVTTQNRGNFNIGDSYTSAPVFVVAASTTAFSEEVTLTTCTGTLTTAPIYSYALTIERLQ